jgi:CelD/BcsL family acetyltransferase involved in cellulose biosynthesis
MIDRVAKSHFVELHKIRDAGMDYLSLLSANKRSQIRRSIKQYEVDAKIQSQQATSAEEALVMLDELARLHEQAWQNRGKTGAFSNKYFFEFHKNLVRNHFCTGSIQLLHIFSEKETIGYLYNFIHHRKVLFYQSGLNYSAGNHYRPGLVSHYYAILHNAVQNMDTYDFLAGDAEYKRSLATDSVPMYWVRLIRSRQRYGLETGSKKIKQAIRTLLKKAKAA